MTPLVGAIHGLIAAGLASMAMTVMKPEAKAEPVVLTKGGHVLYDAGRAETIAAVLNITPENETAYLDWGLQ